MAEIRKALVTLDAPPEELRKITQALAPAEVVYIDPHSPNADREMAQAVQTADVAILNGDLNDAVLSGPNLKWIHCCHAGLDRSARPEVFARNIILTSSSGRSAPALAEHALMFMLALTYDLPMLQRKQAHREWENSREYHSRTGLYGKTAGILGVGKTGLQTARLAKQFNMTTLGWRRSKTPADFIDEMYSSAAGDSLRQLLSRCDYVVLCCELNDSTYHMIGRDELASMKPSAFLINIGRGKLIDEPELEIALRNGVIAGAGLDTFETEPLPAASALWGMPNVIITPHCTPKLPDREARSVEYVLHNIRAYREGADFINRLTEKSIFSKADSATR